MRDRLIAVRTVVSHALEIVVANDLATDAPLSLEGDGTLPALAVRRTFVALDVAFRMRSDFLVEPDEEEILRAMLVRGRGVECRAEPQR